MHAESEGLAITKQLYSPNMNISIILHIFEVNMQGGPAVNETCVCRLCNVLATFPFLGVNSGIGTYDCSMSNFGSSINALNLQVHVNYHAIIFI